MWFNRYSSLNFRVHFFKGTCSRILNILITNQTLRNFFVNSLNVLIMDVNCPLSIKTKCSKCLPGAAPHDRSLFRNDRIALSMNSCCKSFYADSKAVFSSAMSVGFGVYGVLVSHPTLDNNPVHWALRSSDLNINEVILKSQLQFN